MKQGRTLKTDVKISGIFSMRFILISAVSFLTAFPATAGDLHIYPPEVIISGPNRLQQLLVVEEENARVIKDHTAISSFSSSSDKVASVSKTGRITATGNGEA